MPWSTLLSLLPISWLHSLLFHCMQQLAWLNFAPHVMLGTVYDQYWYLQLSKALFSGTGIWHFHGSQSQIPHPQAPTERQIPAPAGNRKDLIKGEALRLLRTNSSAKSFCCNITSKRDIGLEAYQAPQSYMYWKKISLRSNSLNGSWLYNKKRKCETEGFCHN